MDIRELTATATRYVLSIDKQQCLISRFVEDVNTRQRLSFSFPQLWYSPLEFNSRRICQHLTNGTGWNKRDNVWSSANSLFKWRFRSRRHYCCVRSLLGLKGLTDSRKIKSRVNNQTTYSWLWLWRWPPHRLWERQPLTTTDLFRSYTILMVTIYTQLSKKQVSNECIFKTRLVQCDYLWCRSSIAGST